MRSKVYELLKYGANGLIATIIHYEILTFNLTVISIPSAGLSNIIAACFGITSSFLGNYYFVFPKKKSKFISKAIKFSGLYALIALAHGIIMFIWSDQLKIDYRVGFIFATFVQFSLTFIANKRIVFKV